MNIYHDPEKFGLEFFGMVAWYSGYEFDHTAIWRDATGEFLVGSHSGCSCVDPFDNFGVSDLERFPASIQGATWIQNMLVAMQRDKESRHFYPEGHYGQQIVELIERIIKEVK